MVRIDGDESDDSDASMAMTMNTHSDEEEEGLGMDSVSERSLVTRVICYQHAAHATSCSRETWARGTCHSLDKEGVSVGRERETVGRRKE